MASNYGANYTNIFQTSPSVKVDVTDWHSRVRCMYDSFVLAAGSALSIGDKIYVGRLPPGAKIIDACLNFTAFGATGIVDVGYEYVNSQDGSNVTNGIFSAQSIATAGSVLMNDNVRAGSFHGPAAGIAGPLNASSSGDGGADVVIKVTTATDTTGGTIQLQLLYVVD